VSHLSDYIANTSERWDRIVQALTQGALDVLTRALDRPLVEVS